MFVKYQHIERLGSSEVEGIEVGECYIFPKIDGTNASVWREGGDLKAGSRRRELSLEQDNAGFFLAMCDSKEVIEFLTQHPTLRLYGEWLCLSGDTEIRLVSGGKRGHTMTLREMYEYQEGDVVTKSHFVKKDGTQSKTVRPSQWKRFGHPKCFSYFEGEDKIKPQAIAKIIKTGDKDVYEVRTRKGYVIKSTKDHRFLTNTGWKHLSDISVSDVVAVTELYNHRTARRYGKGSRKIKALFDGLKKGGACDICGAKTSLEIHHKDGDWKNNNTENLSIRCRECHAKTHKNVTMSNLSFGYEFDKVTEITYIGVDDCYDISMGASEDSSSFVANGFVVHNCPHSLKTYREDAWRKFYVFDVCEYSEENGLRYLPYPEYQPMLEEFGIDYIPPLRIITNPDHDKLIACLEVNDFLIEDGKGKGEGIVIKNYSFVNKFGRTTWAKIVTSEFKEKHARTMGAARQKGKDIIEEAYAEEHVTQAVVDKVHANIVNDTGWSSRFIPRLLDTVYHDVVVEDVWTFLKKHKYPTINFKTLRSFVQSKVKALKPELF